MQYSLPTGKVIDIPLNLFLDLTDDQFAEELQELVAHNYGSDINDPFSGSVLKEGDMNAPELSDDDIDEIIDHSELLPDLNLLEPLED